MITASLSLPHQRCVTTITTVTAFLHYAIRKTFFLGGIWYTKWKGNGREPLSKGKGYVKCYCC